MAQFNSVEISIGHKCYPKLLSLIKGAPQKLFVCGNIEDFSFDNCLAVVGSRRVTPYGVSVTNSFVKDLATAGICIVSGLMYGVDEIAHTACLEVGGKTIGVLGQGINTLSEKNKAFALKILSLGGLIVSEYEKDFPPARWTFPKRNRIIAGLCEATLVIEACMNSGSLITAHYAKQFKREVFAVPGNIMSDCSKGPLHLIAGSAKVAVCSFDVAKYYKIPLNHRSNMSKGIVNNNSILKILRQQPLSVEDICASISVTLNVGLAQLTDLEIQGLLYKMGDKYYVN